MAINEKKSLPVVIETSNVPVNISSSNTSENTSALAEEPDMAHVDSGFTVRPKRGGGARCCQAAGTPC